MARTVNGTQPQKGAKQLKVRGKTNKVILPTGYGYRVFSVK